MGRSQPSFPRVACAVSNEKNSPIREAVRALELQEARWEAILDTARDAILSIDEKGCVTLFNRAAQEIFGYASSEVIGRNVNMLMASPYREEHDGYLREYKRTGQARAIGRIREVHGRRKNGETFPLELSVSEARIADEAIYSAIVRDVTERHAMLARLERRAREQALVSELGLRALDADLGPLMESAVERVATALDVELVQILEVLPDGTSALLRAGVGFPDGIVGRATVSLEATGSQAGHTFACGQPSVSDVVDETRFALGPLLGEHGAVAGVAVPILTSLGAFGVLGAHARRQVRFTEEDEHFLQLVANVLSGAIENARTSRRLVTQHAVTHALATATSLAHVTPLLLQSLCEGLGWQMAEIWGLDPGGRLRWEGSWSEPGLDATAFQETRRATTLSLDSWLGRACAESAVRWTIDVGGEPQFARAALARGLGLRSAVALPIASETEVRGVLVLFGSAANPPDRALLDLLASVGLQIGDFLARKRAEEIGGRQNRLAEIGALTAKIVHDIGNPLAGLSMLTSRIERRLAREPALPLTSIAEPVGQLDATVRRLVDLIQGFKNFARDQRLELEEIRLQSFLADLVDSWQPEAAERSISLVLQQSDERSAVLADAVKLRRVLDNLVKNALEAVDHGPGEVRIAAGLAEAARIRITVEDTGPGVPPDLRLFELFSTTKPQGTGLGLAIARQIIQAHGGGIELANVKPHGASFHIELPRRI